MTFPGGRGALLEILGGGVCCPVLQILTLFQKCHFDTRFQTWPLRNYVIVT